MSDELIRKLLAEVTRDKRSILSVRPDVRVTCQEAADKIKELNKALTQTNND